VWSGSPRSSRRACTLRCAADLAARIFQGAKPADLPVEIPTHYLFVINMKTAKAMNFTMPNNVLSLADEVIE
jgi:putative tryptophan/tyrosine transport system substrate-binding protein